MVARKPPPGYLLVIASAFAVGLLCGALFHVAGLMLLPLLAAAVAAGYAILLLGEQRGWIRHGGDR
jgi:hypothetical protein